jgi:3-hydroxybutyryl-CoA dehydrogenase
MKIAVVADEDLKEELMAQGLSPDAEVKWLKEINPEQDIEAYIDLSVTHNAKRIEELKKLSPALVIINSVTATLSELPQNFVRINGWPTFLKRPIAEVACINEENKETTEKVFACFNKTIEWVTDIPGFISARVVSMIINEAYFTLQDEVSSKEEIDIAMKLGTNYPYGPFEWSKKIGLIKVNELLSKLAETDSRYEPAALLKKEAFYK